MKFTSAPWTETERHEIVFDSVRQLPRLDPIILEGGVVSCKKEKPYPNCQFVGIVASDCVNSRIQSPGADAFSLDQKVLCWADS